jgi:signal transduction histidine kinase
MGLYDATKIVQKHKGKIWAESEGAGCGATFIIELPIAKDISEQDFNKEDKGKRLF